MVRALFAALCLLSSAAAQSSYTGPLFNPDTAPFFGVSSLVIPTLTDIIPSSTESPTSSRSRVSSAAASITGTTSRNSTVTTSVSRNATVSSTSRSSSVSLITSASRTASVSAPASSTGAAVGNGGAGLGLVVGGVLAGLAMM